MAEVVDFLSDFAVVDDELSDPLLDDELSAFDSVFESLELLALLELLSVLDDDELELLELPDRLSFL